jgi:hypothetical protein
LWLWQPQYRYNQPRGSKNVGVIVLSTQLFDWLVCNSPLVGSDDDLVDNHMKHPHITTIMNELAAKFPSFNVDDIRSQYRCLLLQRIKNQGRNNESSSSLWTDIFKATTSAHMIGNSKQVSSCATYSPLLLNLGCLFVHQQIKELTDFLQTWAGTRPTDTTQASSDDDDANDSMDDFIANDDDDAGYAPKRKRRTGGNRAQQKERAIDESQTMLITGIVGVITFLCFTLPFFC